MTVSKRIKEWLEINRSGTTKEIAAALDIDYRHVSVAASTLKQYGLLTTERLRGSNKFRWVLNMPRPQIHLLRPSGRKLVDELEKRSHRGRG